MKFNSLQFGKAMGAALFVLLLSVAGMTKAIAQNYHWSYNYHDYENTFPLIGEVYINGEAVASSDFEIAAFVGDQVRATEFLFEADPVDFPGHYYAWLGVAYNNIGETVTFKLYDHATETEYDNCTTTVLANTNGYGETWDPCVITFVEQPVLDTTIYIDICHGEDYLDNGFEIYYPEVGENQYSITLPSSQNIDSIVNLTLTVHPTYYIEEDTTLCNITSFQWHEHTYTESGIYYDSLQTIHGCDSIYALSLEFFNTPLGEFTYMTPTNNYPFTSLPITFNWDAVSGAEYYDLYVWDENDPMPNEPFASNLTSRNYSTTALLNYHTYNWFVTARNACYETSSTVKSFYLDIEPSLSVNLSQIDFGEVTFNQSVTTTLNVSGVVLGDILNVQIVGDDAAMFSFTQASGWNDYTGGILIVTFCPTVPQYSYNANLVISSGTLSTTTSLTGGLADMFVFNTYVAEDVYAMNSPIPIYGSLTDVNSIPVVNEEVEIGVFVMGMKRTLQAVTDESGQFSAVFEPMPSESGYYTVNSGRVGNHSTAVHDDFNIPGMTLVSSDYILCLVTQDQPRTDSILIRNKSNLSLSNIQVSPISVPDGASFSFMPLSLSGLEENWLVYTVTGSSLTQGNYYEEAKLKATSSEGAEMNISIWYYCMEPRGVLDVMPKSLATTMTKGKSKIVDVMLTNNGTAATGNITIDLPDVEWMSVVGNDTLSSIAVNDTAYFSLRFSPAEDIQLGQYSGTIAINSERGDAVALSYTITAVSDSTGTLMIDVTDDFTWNTNNGNGPHLEGAEVTLKGYYSLETVAYGFTDADGHFSVEDLSEGYYRLSVTAERHTDYNSVVFVEAGATGRSYTDVFLQYQAVTYSWTVEPTEIPDEYTYELDVVFETHVPVPVIVIEAPDSIPTFDESYTFNYVVTNHGLIDALDVELHVPISDDYLFTPLYDNIDTLHALTSIVIPCVVTHKNTRSNVLRGDCAEWGFVWATYIYRCCRFSPNSDNCRIEHSSAYVYILLGRKPCDSPWGDGNGNHLISLLGFLQGLNIPDINIPIIILPPPPPPIQLWYCTLIDVVYHGKGDLEREIPIDGNREDDLSTTVCAKVTVQFSQNITMTREAFDGTFTVHNDHDTETMEAIGLNFIINDEDGNDCTNLFQINTMLLNTITGIDGTGSLGAGLDGVAKIQFIPTKYAAPTEPKVYYFGGTFSFIDPYSSEELIYDLYPVEITVNPSPDLYVDYFMQRDILGDDALTLDVVEPSIPAELGVIINNKGAGMAKNVLLETAEPQIIDNEKGLAIDFAMYGASFNGSPRQLGLMGISFGNIESGQTAVGEWLFTSSLLGHFVSYEAHVIHNSSYGNADLSLVSHLDIHELIHPIYAYGNLDDGINDFLVNDNPDAYDTPDSIYFSHGGKTSVGVVDGISFDHYVSPSDTIVTLTVEPSRIGWNYGVTDDPGMNQYDIVSCIRNNDNQVIPLNNVWLTFVTIPDGGDPVYENKLHIVDTIPIQQTTTYTLVFAKKPSNLRIFHGNEDDYWSNAANWEGYILPQADDEVLIDGICQLDEDAEVFSLTVAENQSLTIPEDRILTVSGMLTSASVSRLIIEEGGQLFHGNTGVQATVQKTIMPYTEGESDGWYLIAPPLAGSTSVTSVANMLDNEYDLYYYNEPTAYWMNQEYTPNGFAELVNGKGYLYANSDEVLLGFAGELQSGSSTVTVFLNYTEGSDLQGFNLVGNPFVYNLTSYASVNVANGCYQLNEAKDDLIVNEISEENPLKPAEGFFVKAMDEGASITFNPGRGETRNHTGSIRVELSDGGKLIDRLIVKMEGEPLEKMSLKEQRTKVFATQNHQEIAIVPCEGNEQPINFKAAKDGTYTINVNTNGLEFNYLHLIDNLTGADVDLLVPEPVEGPTSYTFNAKTTDYASRFRLVFSVCGDADGDDAPFAFINNGDIIIIGAEAGSTLQIVDMLGHVVRSGDAMNRVSTGGMAKGVYVLRLIEGEKVRTQKIVID